MKIKNIALALSILGFAIGFSNLQENIYFWLGRPVGAIFFIVYFIFALLEKEYGLLDEQERAKLNALNVEKQSASQGSKKETCAPALTTAVSH